MACYGSTFTFTITPKRFKFPAHLILLGFIVLSTTSGTADAKLRKVFVFNVLQPPVTSSLVHSNDLPNTSLLHTLHTRSEVEFHAHAQAGTNYSSRIFSPAPLRKENTRQQILNRTAAGCTPISSAPHFFKPLLLHGTPFPKHLRATFRIFTHSLHTVAPSCTLLCLVRVQGLAHIPDAPKIRLAQSRR